VCRQRLFSAGAIEPVAFAAELAADSTQLFDQACCAKDASTAAAKDSPWQFSLRPYFFLSGVSGSVTVSPVTVPINSSFSDLLNNLRPSGFVAFTAEKTPWGLVADFEYISLGGEGAAPSTPSCP
jgi:hypothetical protein